MQTPTTDISMKCRSTMAILIALSTSAEVVTEVECPINGILNEDTIDWYMTTVKWVAVRFSKSAFPLNAENVQI